MSLPPSTTRFSVESYEGAPEWFAKFIADLNTPLVQLADALGGNLERGTNTRGQIFANLRLAIGATLAADTNPFPLYLKLRNNLKPSALWTGRIVVPLGAGPILSAVQPYWEPTSDGQRIKVRYVTGLTANSIYQITFVAE